MSQHRNTLSDADKDVIIEYYGKESYQEIALRIGKTVDQVKGWRKRNLPSLCSTGKSKFSRSKVVKTCNSNYFEEKSIESAYWAGFIAADGCIIKRKETHQSKLQISIQSRDLEHLVKFKKDLEYKGEIINSVIKKVGDTSFKNDEYYSSTLSVTDEKLCNDLYLMYNIHPRKSLTLRPPEQLPDELILPFIKGYIDGDGYIEKPSLGKSWSARLQILGTLSLLTWIRDSFGRILNIKFEKSHIQNKGNVYSLTLTGKKSMLILSELSKICLGLARKWENIGEWSNNYVDPRRLLTQDQIDNILERLSKGEKQSDIAKDHRVHQVTISNVKLGKIKSGFKFN